MGRRLNKKMLWFLIVSAAAAFVAALLQTSFLPFVGLFGAIPDLLLILVCGVSFYLGPLDGALFGLVAGFLAEALGGGGEIPLLPVFYVATAVLLALLSQNIFADKFIHWILYSGIFCVVKAFYSMLRIVLATGFSSLWPALGTSVFPEWVGTLFLALLLARPVRLLAGLLRGRIDQKKGKGGLDAE